MNRDLKAIKVSVVKSVPKVSKVKPVLLDHKEFRANKVYRDLLVREALKVDRVSKERLVLWVPEEHKDPLVLKVFRANKVQLAHRVNRDPKVIRETQVMLALLDPQVMIMFLLMLINRKSLI